MEGVSEEGLEEKWEGGERYEFSIIELTGVCTPGNTQLPSNPRLKNPLAF